MDRLFSPDFGLALWTIVTFLLLVLFLGRFAWKPFLKVLDDREKAIKNAVDSAAEAQRAADALKKQLEADLAAARAQAQAMLSEAKKDAQELRAKLIGDAEQDVKNLLKRGHDELEAEKDKASQELRGQVAGLAAEIAEKVLRQPGLMKERAALVDSLLNDLERQKKKTT